VHVELSNGYVLCFHEEDAVRRALVLFLRWAGFAAVGARDAAEASYLRGANGAPAVVVVADRRAAGSVVDGVPSLFVPESALEAWLDSEGVPLSAELAAVRAAIDARCRQKLS
jgi:hypothetical protein